MNTQTVEKTVDLEKFLVRASALIKKLGYVSNSEVKGTDKKSTAMLAFEWADDVKPREIVNVTFDSSDKVTGKEVAEWMAGIDTSHITSQDYLFNLANIGVTKTVTERNAGYAASAIGAKEREQKKVVQQATGLEELKKLFGEPGGKISFQLVYQDHSQFDSRFGLCHKYRFTDASGHTFVWMTSTELSAIQQGNAYRVQATIKGFSSYKGNHSIEITRAKIGG